MKNNTATIENLLEKAATYSKTSLELIKSEAVYKLSDIVSNIAVKLTMTIVAVVVLLFMNIALALFMGDYLGATYYGFLAIGSIYFFIAILLYTFKEKWIKTPVSNFIIRKMIDKISI